MCDKLVMNPNPSENNIGNLCFNVFVIFVIDDWNGIWFG